MKISSFDSYYNGNNLNNQVIVIIMIIMSKVKRKMRNEITNPVNVSKRKDTS